VRRPIALTQELSNNCDVDEWSRGVLLAAEGRICRLIASYRHMTCPDCMCLSSAAALLGAGGCGSCP
jgi:hypothetical protein